MLWCYGGDGVVVWWCCGGDEIVLVYYSVRVLLECCWSGVGMLRWCLGSMYWAGVWVVCIGLVLGWC